MQQEDLVFFSAALEVFRQAESAFDIQKQSILEMLPDAEVYHIGSTAIAGLLTKGDLDLLVCVAENRFADADALLALRFDRNSRSMRTSKFASFIASDLNPPLGIQLTTRDGDFATFLRFSESLRLDSGLRAEYAQLKAGFEGRKMEEYRRAKDGFIERVLGQAP